jgi:hypothetical protein
MNDQTKHIFYSSKPRVIHMALNIALAPLLLYLLGAWAWPPSIQHYIVFVITGLPRLVLDESGLTCGVFYPIDNIYKAEGSIRSVTLTILKDGKVKEKIISLGWASREDYKTIVQLLNERFQREVPKTP